MSPHDPMTRRRYVVQVESRFELDADELNRLNAWLTEHNKTCPYYDDGSKPHNPAGALGGTLTYHFTPTNIGTAVRVSCACGAEECNLTDYAKW